ncbi:MAG: ABC transporter ATP-binding protein [Oscillospiraceae bacterium]|nr:ABC transporter ATP-binding protein [Oscillospiraceae bacterium]
MKKSMLRWITKRILGRIPKIVLLTLVKAFHALLTVLFALGSKGVINGAVSGDMSLFVDACVKQAAIIAGIVLSLMFSRHLHDKLQADLECDWKKQLLHGLLHGEYAAVQRFHSAELLNRLNNDVTRVNDGVLQLVPNVAAMITRLIAAISVLGMLDLRFALLLGAVGLVVIGITGLMRNRLKMLNKQVNEHDGRVSGFLQEIMEKLLMVQSMDVSHEVEQRTEGLLEERYAVQRKRKNVSLFANTCVSIMMYSIGFLTLGWCSYRLLKGQMNFGTLTAITQLVSQVQAPFVNLSGIFPQYTALLASSERLMELEEIQGEPSPMTADVQAVYAQMKAIAAEGLSFSYDDDPIFHQTQFSLPKGSFAVITGPSGIGKSTLLKLLLGIIQPDSGRLLLAGEGEPLVLDRSTRRMFSYVPQGNLLLSGSLRDNLTIVRPQATAEEIEQAVYVSAMDEYLPQLPEGLDTRLGENGAGLSEGQAQRLAIARAVLGGAPILLLDECTSALDEATEQKVLQRLKALPERTCIAVTHRPAAIALCDWRLEVLDGKITAVKA